MPLTPGEEPGHWPELHRERRALVVVDVVESVRLMQQHEDEFIERWRRFVNEVRSELLPRHGGRLVKSLGDGMLLEFGDVRDSLAAAFDMQACIERVNAELALDRQLQLRTGLHVADVVRDELDLHGQGVNLTSRLATLAGPGDIVISAEIRDQLVPGLDVDLIDLGACYLKHIEAPVTAFLARPVSVQTSLAQVHLVPDSPAPAERGAESLPALAIMPLNAHADVPHGPVVADLLADGLTTRLSACRSLRVISRLSCATFKRRRPPPQDAVRLLGARYLLDGRLHNAGSRLYVYAELTEAATGDIVWATRQQTSVPELLRTDDEFSADLAQQVSLAVSEHELRRCITRPLPTLHEQALQFSATNLMHRSSTREFEQAHEVLQHLIDRHPRNPTPHAWAAMWHVLRITRGLNLGSPEQAGRALDHTRRALAIDCECALALAMEGFVYCHIVKDLARADERLAAAVKANPNESWAWLVRSVVASHLGDANQAWAWACQAASLSPLDPIRHYYDGLMASAAVGAGQFAKAVELAIRSLSVNRGHLPTLRALAIAQVELDDITRARETVATILTLDPDFTLKNYMARVPPGGEAIRERYAAALGQAGAPAG